MQKSGHRVFILLNENKSKATHSQINRKLFINTGPLTTGVIGVKKLSYDLCGDIVNTASRMESYCEVGTIHISDEMYELNKNEFN